MQTRLIALLLISTSVAFGQVTFEKGYFINNDNQRIECLIKNYDQKNNPKEFLYKTAEGQEVLKGDLYSVKEFGVTGYSKFVRADVKMDMSGMGTSELSKQRDPEWSRELLFLKVLLESKSTLYYFEGNGLIRFFYSVPDSAIKQLIYKEYVVEENQVASNYKFRQQLWLDVRCANSNTGDLERIKYNKNDLERYFKKYNESYSILTVTYGRKSNKNSYHFRICPGLNYSSVKLKDLSFPGSTVDFGNQMNFSMGLDAEIILPYNKNKWGFVFTPSYQYFKATADYENTPIAVTIDYQSIEFPIGLRYYFMLNKDLKLFVNALFISSFSFDFNSTFTSLGLEIKTSNSMALGGGISYKRFSTEMRYYSNRELLSDYINRKTEYKRLSLIIGYKLF